MHLIYPTSIYKWDIYNLYNYTRPVRAMHDLYKSALALCVLFYFLRLLYVYSSPYLTRDTHYKLINYITFRVLLCVTYSDYLAVLTIL
jgi:quinol-cytochrome oxidoreductase complex cytochrome b subunit